MAFRKTVFSLDSQELAAGARRRVRWGLGLSGVAALVIGVLVVVWPGGSAVVMADLFGIYWIVAGIGYILVGIFTTGMKAWSRVLDIVLGVFQLVVGVIVLANPAESAVVLGLFLGIWLGALWIIEGVVTLVQSADGPSHGWAIFLGIVSLLGGIAVLTSPLWAVAILFTVAGILLIVLGVAQIVRAFTFGGR
ncbi:MAG: DUF308 domain-containing protein [Propionibacteriaceae bacterium]|jgi:uncharacterized membrane protein HdeD (DUF308 family)|nr:DUF308 domain-containing protein [Propionibacteriaceae bacterium]